MKTAAENTLKKFFSRTMEYSKYSILLFITVYITKYNLTSSHTHTCICVIIFFLYNGVIFFCIGDIFF